jgi:prepilin-type N-terminal cleavage/methylation domain-containing protein
MKINNQQENKGFTLIELMVATSIFVVVMLASMSSLFVLLDSGKSSRALRFAMDNVNFAMESMTRSIRMGTNYYCGLAGQSVDLEDLSENNYNDCLSGEDSGTLIAFKPQDTVAIYKVAYQLLDEAIVMTTDGGVNWVPITSDSVKIERLRYFVKGSAPNDNTQASVYIIIKGTVMVKDVPTSFSLQTLASQRNF